MNSLYSLTYPDQRFYGMDRLSHNIMHQQMQLLDQQYLMQQQWIHSLMNLSGLPVVIYYPVQTSSRSSAHQSDKRRRPLQDFWTKEVLNSERRKQAKKQTKLASRLGRKLKRLQRTHPSRRMGDRNDVKDQWKRYRMLKAGKVQDVEDSRCGLWHCDGRRPRLSNRKSSLRRSRSLRSVLSNLSARCRSPIVFRGSPIRNREGFVTNNC